MGSTEKIGGSGGAQPLFVVPFLRHSGFVGRDDDLAKVHALLQKGEAVGVRPVEAVGMGGIGKTQLAVEYAYRHRADYPGGVYWVNAARRLGASPAARVCDGRPSRRALWRPATPARRDHSQGDREDR